MESAMLLSDKDQFEEMLIILFDAYNKVPTDTNFNTWFTIFEEYEIPIIKIAFIAYSKSSKFPPVPAGVLEYIGGRERNIGAEEAWDHVPKLEHESGYVTGRMMQALGVAEELLAMNDYIGARLAFIRTYDNLPEDNNFKYSQAYGVPYEDKKQRKIDDYKLLENKGWIKKENLLKLKPPELLMIENGSSKTLTESQKKLGKDTVSTILEMLNSSQTNTGLEENE